jgi:hypothetical protein
MLSITILSLFSPLALAGINVQLSPSAPDFRTYQLQYSFEGDGFFGDSWTWATYDDPTHGRVNFVNKDTAQQNGLAYVDCKAFPSFEVNKEFDVGPSTATKNTFIMAADSTNVVSPNERGRDSVRISSSFGVDEGIFILDLVHMPEGCGTWPAFWSASQSGPWPQGGEIDIIEGERFYFVLFPTEESLSP